MLPAEHERPKSACWILMWRCYCPPSPATPNAHFHNLLFWNREESARCWRIWSLSSHRHRPYKPPWPYVNNSLYVESVSSEHELIAVLATILEHSIDQCMARNDSRRDCFACTHYTDSTLCGARQPRPLPQIINDFSSSVQCYEEK